jgi:hypothetical protein
MRRFILGAAAVVLAAVIGCVAHVHSDAPYGRTVVVVDAGHVCYDSCEHFYLDGVWYIERGHRHGPNCGHFLVKGKWGRYKDDDHPGKGPPDKVKDKDKDNDKNQDKDKDKGKGKDKDKDHDKDKGKDDKD